VSERRRQQPTGKYVAAYDAPHRGRREMRAVRSATQAAGIPVPLAPPPAPPPAEAQDRPTPVEAFTPFVPDAPASNQACLVAIYGAELGQRVELAAAPLIVGRDPESGFVVDDETVSRRHCEIAWTGRAFRVRDLGSTNRTFVNDAAVGERGLRHGDLIKLGRNIFKFLHGGSLEHDYHQVIHALMTHDGLTNAHNRRFFEQALVREMLRAERYQRPLALAMIDVDHFKAVNDSLGHLAGDEILRQIARVVQANVRGESTFARVGGEEFAIIFPETTLEGAARVSERLRGLIEGLRLDCEGTPVSVTCSFGVAAFAPGTGAATDDLYAEADRRLYEAKRAGRNRVVWEG
jgi:diguanylate cyclase (GGDEF)-like protein